MKKILTTYFFCVWAMIAQAQSISSDKNAIIHSEFRTATTNIADGSDPTKAKISVQYFDGLGRPLQSVGYQQSPTSKDIVSGAVIYDVYGRVTQQNSTTPMGVGTGNYQNNSSILTAAQSFYGDANPYTLVKTFDNSPLNRVLEQYGVGQAWQNNQKFVKTDFGIAGTDVRLYRADASHNINLVGTFLANSINKTTYTDEQGHQSIEYKDRSGKLIQKQVQDDSGFMTTYYVYDAMDRLVAILQPKAYDLNASISVNSIDWNEGVFFNIYNAHRQITQQKVPSADWTYFVYDNWDRLVLTQTGMQRELQTWTFYKYDVLNREIMRGEFSDGATLQSAQAYVYANATNRYESPQNTDPIYYTTNITYPNWVGANELRQITYYDTYANWLPTGMSFDASNAFGQSQYPNVQGLQIGSRSKNSETGNWLASVLYFDNKGRVIQTFANNLYGQIEHTDFQYNFAGEAVQVRSLMKKQDGTATTKIDAFSYDNVGRKLTYQSDIQTGTTATPQETCTYQYDEIGRQQTKKIYPSKTFLVGGAKDYITRPSPDGAVSQSNTQDLARKAVILQPTTDIKALTLTTYTAQINANASQGTPIQGLQTIDYTHHIRGGLRGINLDNAGNPTPNASQGDLFSYKLDYESARFYDGNIGKQTWQNANATNFPSGVRGYVYGYDAASRLKNANYTGINGENYSLPNISYDRNGNITALQRNGKNNNTYGLIDDLTYNLSGNRLIGVTDAVSGNENVGDFRDNGSNSDYTYWSDGSLKSDANKGIDSIQYNDYLKKVSRVHFSNGNWVNFFYDGNGTLLKRTNSAGDLWEYTPTAIYKNGALYQINQKEGRILFVAGVYVYEFEYRDHLGNLRVSFNGQGNRLNISQIQEQDPFGLSIQPLSVSSTSTSQNFKFEEKESLLETGWINFGARVYDPQVPHLLSVDNLADAFGHISPYSFALNNPLSNVDFDGDSTVPIHNLDWHNFDTKNNDIGLDAAIITANSPQTDYSNLLSDIQRYGGGNRGFIGNLNVEKPTSLAGNRRFRTPQEMYGMTGTANYDNSLTTLAIPIPPIFKWIRSFRYMRGINNIVPNRLARVIPAHINAETLGASGAEDVFVTASDDIAGMNASQIANRLTIPNSGSGFKIIQFDTPITGLASPINRTNAGFIGFGRTAGGAREFVIPNQIIPNNSTITTVR